MPPRVKESPWASFEKGEIIEIECRDDRRLVQGKALLLCEGFVRHAGVPYAEATHLGASDSYYAWWADKDQPASGAAKVKGHFLVHPCEDSPRDCKVKEVAGYITLHCRDAVPIRKNWVKTILLDYQRVGGSSLGLAR